MRPCGIELGYEGHVRGSVRGRGLILRLDGALNREIRGTGESRYIKVPRLIRGYALGWADRELEIGRHISNIVVAAAAEVSKISQHRVDDQRAGMVVFPQRKLHAVSGQPVAARNRLPFAFDDLIYRGLAEAERRAIHGQRQAAVRGEPGMGAGEFQRNLPGIGSGRNHEIVFQLPLAAVIDEVDAMVNLLVTHLAVGAGAAGPLLRIAADEIIHFPGESLAAGNPGVRVRSGQLHPDHRGDEPPGAESLLDERSLNTALSEVKNSAYPSPRERNFTAGSVWPWLASKLRG